MMRSRRAIDSCPSLSQIDSDSPTRSNSSAFAAGCHARVHPSRRPCDIARCEQCTVSRISDCATEGINEGTNLDDGTGDQVLDTHALPDEHPDLGRADVVPHELVDESDVVLVEGDDGTRVDGGGGEDGLVEFRLGAFNDIATVLAEDVVELEIGKKS